jgi:hypothetical protein
MRRIDRQACIWIGADLGLVAMRLLVVIAAQSLKPSERRERIAALMQRYAVMNLDRFGELASRPARLAQMVDRSQLALA